MLYPNILLTYLIEWKLYSQNFEQDTAGFQAVAGLEAHYFRKYWTGFSTITVFSPSVVAC